MNNFDTLTNTLMSMCLDRLQGGIDKETFTANIKMFAESFEEYLNEEKSVDI